MAEHEPDPRRNRHRYGIATPAPVMFKSTTRDIPEARSIPRHVAIIMDGNGRWAKQRHLPRVAGHRKGVEAVRAIVRACIERGIAFLTLFAFSSENWRRPEDEVSILMELFLRALEQEVAKLDENGIRLKVVGDTSRFAPRIRELIAAGEALTGGQQRAHAYGCGKLRRPLGHRPGCAPLFRHASRRPARRGRYRSRCAGSLFRDGLRARTGPVHPHRRRAAHLELPAVAARVYRTPLQRNAVAGFRRGGPRRRHRLVSSARAALSAAPASRCRTPSARDAPPRSPPPIRSAALPRCSRRAFSPRSS